MKKLFSVLLAIMLTGSLAACGAKTVPDSWGAADIESKSDREASPASPRAGAEPSVAPSAGGGAMAVGTVASAVVTPGENQMLYLWEEGNAPTVTDYTVNDGNYFDEPDFRPCITTFPAADGVSVKGAVLICAGGGFNIRSDQLEGTPIAEEFSRLGYQSFVVDYRLLPYTPQEGALDLARAVRFVLSHAEEYDVDKSHIALVGFSAGGMLTGEMLRNFDGAVDGTALDPSYLPDKLDTISAEVSANGMIYSFYGWINDVFTDAEEIKAAGLPPTYFTYGTADSFSSPIEESVAALREAGVPTESHALQDMPHGFGISGNWIPDYDRWLTEIFVENDTPM